MAKFIYNFEQILNIKQKLERQEQMNLGKAMQNLTGAIQRLDALEIKQSDTMKSFQQLLSSGRIDQLRIKSLNEKVKFFHEQVIEQRKVVLHHERLVEEAKEKLHQALRERKTYEILKEKAYEEYLEEEKAAEAKQIDEIVSFKYKDER